MKNAKVDTFANRLKKAMTLRGIRQVDVVRQTSIRKQQINQYVHGLFEAKQQALYELATLLKVNPAWLMGYDVDSEGLDVDAESPRRILTSGEQEYSLMTAYRRLNPPGQTEAVKRVSELSELPKYVAGEKTADVTRPLSA